MVIGLVSAVLVAGTASAQTRTEADGRLSLAWAEYGDLWVGDLLLGGFALSSPPDPLDRLQLRPEARITVRTGDAHRFRVHPNLRTLQRATVLGDALEVRHAVLSDGAPLGEAVKERLFLDELSWRFRPGGDRWLETRIGIQRFAIADGRFLAESWPGARLRLDAARRGWVPLAVDARFWLTSVGTPTAALAIRHEPSLFEFIGVELAWARDHRGGLADLVSADLGMQLDVFSATGADVIDANPAILDTAFDEAYREATDGIRLLQSDLRRFQDLSGRADLLYLFAGGRRLVGPVRLAAGTVYSTGWAQLDGDALAFGDWDAVTPDNWPEVAPRERFEAPFRVHGLAWDGEVEVTAGRLLFSAFFQGMTGGDDPVDAAAAGEPVTAFLATDHAFLRTRLFPVSSNLRTGSWSLPPGVSTHGLATPGLGAGVRVDRYAADLQAALPIALVPSPLEPNGSLYGGEVDLIVGGAFTDHFAATVDGGLFRPGAFFADDSDPDGTLPTGWRLFASVVVTAGG